MKKLFLLVLLAAVVAAVVLGLPDIKRYWKMQRM